MKVTTILKSRIGSKKILPLPGIYDGLTAKLVRHAGMDAAYLSGACLSMGLLGQPDIGLISFNELLNQARYLVNALGEIPLVVDADTGFGNAINLIRTIQELESVGVAGIQIEDQVTPKKCGHFEGKQVISTEEMVLKIEAARDTRKDPDFIIIARTDARAGLGFEEAIHRARAYRKAGADVLFVEAPQSEQELRRLPKELDAPLLANMVEGGKTPLFSAKELEEMGFSIALFPGSLQRAAFHAFLKVLDVLKRDGKTIALEKEMISFALRNEIMRLQNVYELEKRYLSAKK